MANETALDGPGVFNLGQVKLFFKKMKIDLSQIEIKQHHFFLLRDYEEIFPQIFQEFYDLVTQTKLCPVIGTQHRHNARTGHAMVVDHVVEHGDKWFLQCKNSYKHNPTVFVGNLDLPKITYRPSEAIILHFERK